MKKEHFQNITEYYDLSKCNDYKANYVYYNITLEKHINMLANLKVYIVIKMK